VKFGHGPFCFQEEKVTLELVEKQGNVRDAVTFPVFRLPTGQLCRFNFASRRNYSLGRIF